MITWRRAYLARACVWMLAVGAAGCSGGGTSVANRAQPVHPAAATVEGASGSDAIRKEFHEAYGAARRAVDDQLDPLIVVRFDDVYLVRGGRIVEEGTGVPTKYHSLSRVAHIPLTTYLRLRPAFGKPLDDAALADLEALEAALDEAELAIDPHAFTAEEAAWQSAVIDSSRDFIKTLRTARMVTESDFQAYQARVHGPMMAMSDASGAAQMDALHSLMRAWRPTFSDEEWGRVRVMIIGPRQPRSGCAATQYFAALFDDRPNTPYAGESERVFYVESVDIDVQDTSFASERKLVATMMLDAEASAAFFHNRDRMSIDVMADGAARRIGSLDFSGLR